jgi:hypothetical protein
MKHKLKCGTRREEDGFYFWSNSKGWVSPSKYEELREKSRAQALRWRAKNIERSNANARAWRAANSEKQKQACRLWYLKNRKLKRKKRTPQEKALALKETQARTRAVRKKAPSTKCAKERSTIRAIYLQAELASSCVGIPFHVDHIVPLARGGGHFANNLQVLPAKLNLKKGAKLPYIL